MEMFGAFITVRGTLPAIDQGISAAMTMTVFSSAIAIFFLSFMSVEQS